MSILISDKEEEKVYMVFGAPHSATSFVSKALEDQGVSMGSDMKHLYQDSSFVRANNNMIKEAGGWWNELPSQESIDKVDGGKYIKRQIKNARRKRWGFKDPRTSLTAKKYFDHLEGDVYLICCFRKPERVVKSYNGKHNVTRELIDEYNRRIVDAIKEFTEIE